MAKAYAVCSSGRGSKKKREISDTVSPLIALLAARGAGGILQIFCVRSACILQDLKSESCSAQNEKCDVDFDLKPYKYLLRPKNHRGFFFLAFERLKKHDLAKLFPP